MTASDTPLPAGVILAGGRSSRMGGRDKALCTLAGLPLAGWCAERLKPQVAALALNANGDPQRFAALGLPVLADPLPGHPGPLGGILAALDWAEGKHPAVVTVAVDTPFFPLSLVEALSRAAGGGVAVAASAGRVHPVFALWPCGLRGALRHFLGAGTSGRVMTFLEQVGFATVPFPSVALAGGPLDPFFNVNTPADLLDAEALAGRLPQ